MKTRAHYHIYGTHPNPGWAQTHAACTVCGMALPFRLVRIALRACPPATATPELLNTLQIPFFPTVLK